jgi:hypothetical protein
MLLVLVGAAAGGVGVWLWIGRRMREHLQTQLSAAARKSARAVDWAKSEAAMQLERRDQEIAALRARVDERDHSVEQVRSRLQADLALAQQERTQWESRTAELSRRAEELNTQVRRVTLESHRDVERLRGIAQSLERVVADYTTAIEAMDARLRPRADAARPPGSVSSGSPTPVSPSRPVAP